MIDSILKILQLLILPLIIMLYKHMRKQIESDRDIRDLKTYMLAVCKNMDIPCVLKDV